MDNRVDSRTNWHVSNCSCFNTIVRTVSIDSHRLVLMRALSSWIDFLLYASIRSNNILQLIPFWSLVRMLTVYWTWMWTRCLIATLQSEATAFHRAAVPFQYALIISRSGTHWSVAIFVSRMDNLMQRFQSSVFFCSLRTLLRTFEMRDVCVPRTVSVLFVQAVIHFCALSLHRWLMKWQTCLFVHHRRCSMPGTSTDDRCTGLVSLLCCISLWCVVGYPLCPFVCHALTDSLGLMLDFSSVFY
jgi:hypothetical protein